MKVSKPPPAEKDVIKSSTSVSRSFRREGLWDGSGQVHEGDTFNLPKLFIYTGSSIRPEAVCPVTKETQTSRSRLYSMTKHSRLTIDGEDELKWLDTLKRPIKCMLGKKGEEKDAGFICFLGF